MLVDDLVRPHPSLIMSRKMWSIRLKKWESDRLDLEWLDFRFWVSIQPHLSSRFTYFPGSVAMSTIPTDFDQIRKLVKGFTSYIQEVTTSLVLLSGVFQSTLLTTLR